MSDYDQIEKIFNGSWKYDRDENVEAFMAAVGETNFIKCEFISFRKKIRSNENL